MTIVFSVGWPSEWGVIWTRGMVYDFIAGHWLTSGHCALSRTARWTRLGCLPQSWKLDCSTCTTIPIIPTSSPIIHLNELLLPVSGVIWALLGRTWNTSLGWTWLLSDEGCDQREEAGKSLEYVSGVCLSAVWRGLDSLWPDECLTMMSDPERNMPDSRHMSVTPDMSDMSDSVCPRHFRCTSKCWWVYNPVFSLISALLVLLT